MIEVNANKTLVSDASPDAVLQANAIAQTATPMPAPKKVDPKILALGEAAKTGFIGLFGAGIAAGTAVYFGKNKYEWLAKLARSPESAGGGLKKGFKDFFKLSDDKFKEVGDAAVVGAGVGTLVSWFTHAPGLFSGYNRAKKINSAAAVQTEDNTHLVGAVKVLAEDNARLNAALAKIQRPDPSALKDEAQTQRM